MPESLASELFLDQLAAEGTRYIFGTPGPTLDPLLSCLSERTDIIHIVGLHEQTAVGMATGYAQVSGKAGVVILDGNCGLASGLSALLNAWSAKVPLVVAVGQQDSRIANELGSAQDLPLLAKSFLKWSCQAHTAEELPAILRRAFHEACSPPTGPTITSVPVNLFAESVSNRVILPPRNAPLGAADATFLKTACQILISASKPAIIAGNEVSQYRARKQAVALAEVLGCPVFCEPLPTGLNFPNRHPLFAGILPFNQQESTDLLQGHDVVLVLGMQTRRPSTFGKICFIPSSAVVVQVNVDSSLAGQALPCHFSAQADPAETLSRLRAELQLQVDTQWVSNAKARSRQTASWAESLQNRQTQEQVAPTGAHAISPKWFLSVLDTVRPPKSIVVNDYAGGPDIALQILNLDGSSAYIASNGSALGYGIAASTGAQLAGAEYTAICLTSGASVMHQPQALWTAAHLGLHTKTIVFNQQKLKPPISFLELAGSMDIPANCISKASEIEAALSELFASEGPYLLDVRLN